jgi:hypothetical protein
MNTENSDKINIELNEGQMDALRAFINTCESWELLCLKGDFPENISFQAEWDGRILTFVESKS